ncbi:hypothetical protein D7X33_26225 [Butyricicoccus sp. 1XD8-22]|nr:hypothetical protein D7X33_26225 [Butyricicoccus sp. 1XD8-22]
MEIRFNNEVYDLTINGLRKLLHDDVNSIFNEIDEPTDSQYNELELIHEYISSKDIEALTSDGFFEVEMFFELVHENDLLIEALKINGYSVESSNVSRSVYAINDKGIEVRISDHKRPAIVQNGMYIGEHDYSIELIVDDNIVNGERLVSNGFNKMDIEKDYILG